MLEILSSPFAKDMGTGGIVLICFWLMFKANQDNIKALIASFDRRTDEHFSMNQKLLDMINLNSSLLQKIADDIRTNEWCPYARSGRKKKGN